MGGPSRPEAVLDLVLEPHSDRFDPDDDRWRRQVGDLYRGLDDELGGVRREGRPVEGTKGVVDTVILALGSAGAFTAAVEMVRAWLSRDRGRSLDVSWEVDGRKERVTVTGAAVDNEAIDTIASAVAARIGEKPWPNPPTAPS
ncbi:MAG TPA: hypothetical protein VK402_11045 [Blastococcus sp.]|nr:hypothetical protein [Blastococcus sp.]